MARYLFEYAAFALFSFLTLTWLWLKRRYKVIVVHNQPTALVFTTLIPRLAGTKVLLDMHECTPEAYISKYKVDERHPMIRLLRFEEVAGMKFANHVLTVSEPMRLHLAVQGKLDPDQDIDVVLNLPSDHVFDISAVSQDRPTDRFTLVYTGTVAERYGLETAIRALDLLRDEMPDLHLLVVGDGDDIPRLQEIVRALRLEAFVEFREPVLPERIPGILATSHVGIAPHYNDPFFELYFSNKIVEYLRIGLPVISSRTKALEYYLDDSVMFYCEPGDVHSFAEQIRCVRSDTAAVTERRERAERLLEKLTWSQQRVHYLQVIEHSLGVQGGE
jgi:glycosyltransferase involved in cell wall biosynthesis